MTTGSKGQPHLVEYGSGDSALLILFALITVATPASATCTGKLCSLLRLRRSSEGHSAPACGRGFHLSPLSGPPVQRVLVLFIALGAYIQLGSVISDICAIVKWRKRRKAGDFNMGYYGRQRRP